MSVEIISEDNRKLGRFKVSVNMSGRWEYFDSMVDAQKWLKLMKESSHGKIEKFFIKLCEAFISPKNQTAYTTYYVM